MQIKVFVISGAKNIESTIQRWLDDNPSLTIHFVSQSSSTQKHPDDNIAQWHYQIIIFYTENPAR